MSSTKICCLRLPIISLVGAVCLKRLSKRVFGAILNPRYYSAVVMQHFARNWAYSLTAGELWLCAAILLELRGPGNDPSCNVNTESVNNDCGIGPSEARKMANLLQVTYLTRTRLLFISSLVLQRKDMTGNCRSLNMAALGKCREIAPNSLRRLLPACK